MKHSRTTNSFYNFITGIGGQMLKILMDFLVRTVFIAKLGKVFLGLNGLFSNILTMLSLAELGVGSAIIYKLYEPIARNDQHRIAVLMRFYKKAYAIIGFVIAFTGICLIPLLPVLIKNYHNYENLEINLTFVYLLFLSRTVSTYFFFAYKSALIKANQKEYVLNIISYFFTIITAIIRIVALYFIPKFELYVLISICCTIAQNIAYAIKANRLYPYLKTLPKENISKEEQKGILKDCSALLIYKINLAVLKGTDSFIISSFLGLESLGIYSNYYLFYTTLNNICNKIYGSIAHGIGDLHAVASVQKEYIVFKRIHLITAIIAGTTFVGIATVANDLITAWVGKEWVYEQPVAFLLGLEVYTLAYRQFLSRYRTAMGLFRQAKYRPLFGMIINLLVSIIMVQIWGVCGVLFGTILADWLTYMPFDPYIIHKYGFSKVRLVKKYYLNYTKYFITSVFVYIALNAFFNMNLFSKGWVSIALHILICCVVTPISILLISGKTEERKYVTQEMMRYVKRIILKK